MSARPAHPNALAWARHLAGETGGLSGWRFRRHLASCPACRERAASAAREREDFESDPRSAEALRALRQRARQRSPDAPRPTPWAAWALTAAGAAGAVALLVVGRTDGPAALAAKGGDLFTLHVERPAGAEALGTTCAAGDRLMPRYRTARSFLLVLERDGAGGVQAVYPWSGDASVLLTSRDGAMPQSWQLDATPGEECFFAFFSDAPVALSAARAALAASPAAPSLPGVAVRAQCCRKAAKP